jgi:DUF177 domain-containing protein
MLQIHIGSISEQGLDIHEAVETTDLPLLHAVSREETVHFVQPVHMHLHATRAGETIRIDGTLVTGVRIPCSRCLQPFDLPVETHFSATAAPQQPPLSETDAAAEIELAAEDMDVIAYSGDSIELADEIAQQVIMALPFKPLCREACKGLCSRCGADLNKTPCQCAANGETNPFAVLKKLSFPSGKD